MLKNNIISKKKIIKKPIKNLSSNNNFNLTENALNQLDNIFDEYEKNADAALRSTSKSNLLTKDKLDFFKKNFVNLTKS